MKNGRLRSKGKTTGTGFVISEKYILTNRHVIEKNIDEDKHKFLEKSQATFNLGSNYFSITDIVSTSNRPINGGGDFSKIDYAVLKCDISNASLPKPLTVDTKKALFNNFAKSDIYTLGYPAKPSKDDYIAYEKYGLMLGMFNQGFGIKRLSPGAIEQKVGNVNKDYRNTVFTHNCTTLGGSSGSPIITIENKKPIVIGLHFGGNMNSTNYAHAISKIDEIASLVSP